MKKQETPQTEKRPAMTARQIIRLVALTVIWLALFGLSFFTYFSIPFLIFATWFIIAWLLKLFKRDEKGGSGYDREF